MPMPLRLLFGMAVMLGPAPASATHGWDYTCRSTSGPLKVEAEAVFSAGTIGAIRLDSADVKLAPADGGPAAAPTAVFDGEDVEQFWTDPQHFRLSISTYIGDEPENARLLIDTSCQDLKCAGSYRFTWKGAPQAGNIACTQTEPG